MLERAKEMIERALGRDTERRRAHELYVEIAEAARRPELYTRLAAPDTTEGRYDVLSLHVILVLRRLKTEKPRTAKFAQLLFDIMFRDVDDTLREMGVGDMRVGKKVREYAEAFFGRALAYERALDGEENLAHALGRNVYGDEEAPQAEELADYARRADAHLAGLDCDTLMGGHVSFPPVTAEEEEAHA